VNQEHKAYFSEQNRYLKIASVMTEAHFQIKIITESQKKYYAYGLQVAYA
jgi:HD-like signal output (HDOD) protein